jgi:hypothetical protein
MSARKNQFWAILALLGAGALLSVARGHADLEFIGLAGFFGFLAFLGYFELEERIEELERKVDDLRVQHG